MVGEVQVQVQVMVMMCMKFRSQQQEQGHAPSDGGMYVMSSQQEIYHPLARQVAEETSVASASLPRGSRGSLGSSGRRRF